MSSAKDANSLSVTNSVSSSSRSLDQVSNVSDDSFKTTRTSASNQNIDDQVDCSNKKAESNKSLNESTNNEASHNENKEPLNNSSASKNDSSITESEVNSSTHNDSSKTEQTDSTPSSSSIDLEQLGQLINNLEISDDHDELTNSVINLINRRDKRDSVQSRSKNQTKKMSIVSLDLDGVVDYIKEKKCQKIIVMIGAGVSTSAGIPDFRSPDSGIFAKLKKYNITSPECVFEINYFKKNPLPFFELGAEIFTSKKYKPTPTHNFIKLLDDKGLLLRLYTQNIDGLEAECGLRDEKVVYAHGSFNKSHCLNCNHEYDFEFMKNFMSEERNEIVIPRCKKCNVKPTNIIKPDIVFYGQRLPTIFFERLEEDFPQCDLLLVMGTSLVVQPFAGLVNEVRANVPRILINRERTGEFLKYDKYLNMRTGQTEKCNERDIFLQGDSDKIIIDIADKLGWTDEMAKLNK